MAKINWQPYDIFQVLARRVDPSFKQRRETNFDVHLYGVYIEGGCIFIGKIHETISDTAEEKEHKLNQICARVEAQGLWKVVVDKSLESIFLPQTVPLNLRMQWVPAEVKLVIDAILLARPKPPAKPKTSKKLENR